MSKLSRLAFALLLLFVASGFAGLIYQSVWSHYLGLTLGHAAYAQTLVLAIFMGGMALGAWLASRYSPQWRRLILGYAVVEAAIGILGLLFHPAFVAYTGFSQDTVLPALSSPGVAHAWQWLSAAVLIAPQSILLGITFPLMSAGLMRALPQQEGEVLGGLYFTNSLGAAVGALTATFVLLPAVGLPGTVFTAGMLNIAVALGAWALSKALDEGRLAPITAVVKHHAETEGNTQGGDADEIRQLGRILMVATAISGAASFVYEVGWVRLLNQALGTTVHSFELMLAAFIIGLAFGGLWIRKRARNIADPVRYVGYVQVLMGIAALLSIPVFTQSFEWVGWMMSALARSEHGYTLFELGTAAISLLVMFPAAFLAGMTLPLFTLALLRAGAGERAIGRIYAANTLGAIAGVALAMHVLIPVLGVRLAVTLAALVDALVGLYLIRRLGSSIGLEKFAAALIGTGTALAFSLLLGRPDPLAQASGVYRSGIAQLEGAKVEYLRDGKTATVSIFTTGNIMAIATNGKPDAALTGFQANPTPDEPTMTMAGVIPLMAHPAPKQIAIIGWGSGLTTHTLLGSDVPESVETIEIERAMYDAAQLFGHRVERAYKDPRSHLLVEDARTYFSTGARKYDVIVSEPSNPWVSGVASLFTQEFYAFLRHHLNDGGMLVQWLHTYELNDPLVATMLSALLEEFPNAEIYVTYSTDLLIVARKGGGAPGAKPSWRPGNELLGELRRVGMAEADDVPMRRIGGAAVLKTFVRNLQVKPHSDFFPTVSLQAPKARFLGTDSSFLQNLVTNGLPVLDVLECRRPYGRAAQVSRAGSSTYGLWRLAALQTVDALESGRLGAATELDQADQLELQALLARSAQMSTAPHDLKLWMSATANVARATIGLMPAEELQKAWVTPAWLSADAMAIPEVQKIMDAYSAAARRSPTEMRGAALQVLALPAGTVPAKLREQMLVIAMLGALGAGDPAAVAALEQQYGSAIERGEYGPIRSYLGTWGETKMPVCRELAAARAAEPTAAPAPG